MARQTPATRIRTAIAHQQAGRTQEAATIYAGILRTTPHHPDANHLYGLVHLDWGRPEEAIGYIRRAVQTSPKQAPFHFNLGSAYMMCGRFDEAATAYERVLELLPKHAESIAALARVHELRGDDDAVRRVFDEHASDIEQTAGMAAVLARCDRRDGRPGDGLARIDEHLARPDHASDPPANPVATRNLLFTRADLCDRLGMYEDAASALERASRLKGVRFDADAFAGECTALIKAFDPTDWERMEQSGVESEQPVLIVGMPRSGTSLVEQIIATHSQAAGAGELTIAPSLASEIGRQPPGYPARLGLMKSSELLALGRRYLEALHAAAPDERAASRITDKLPSNFRRLGLIRMLLPKARIVHCTRSPEDVAISCYFQEFPGRTHPYAYDMQHLAAYYVQYERVMAHWRRLGFEIHDIGYEDLVSDQEAQSRRLIEAIGLPWEDACLKFHETRRNVATSSHEQVRRPMYRGSVGRSKHYAELLAPFQATLESERERWGIR